MFSFQDILLKNVHPNRTPFCILKMLYYKFVISYPNYPKITLNRWILVTMVHILKTEVDSGGPGWCIYILCFAATLNFQNSHVSVKRIFFTKILSNIMDHFVLKTEVWVEKECSYNSEILLIYFLKFDLTKPNKIVEVVGFFYNFTSKYLSFSNLNEQNFFWNYVARK